MRRGRCGTAAANVCHIQLGVVREVGLERGVKIKSLSIKCHTFK